MLTAQRLREVLNYNPKTGEFTWLVALSKKTKIGSVAGTVRDGYINIQIDGQLNRAHRLAWLHMTGEWPKSLIDHRDLNRSNNRWINIRPASTIENNANWPMLRTNASGYRGVRWYRANKRWSAQIGVNRKSVHLGYFDTAEEAHAAYCVAAKALWGEFARAS